MLIDVAISGDRNVIINTLHKDGDDYDDDDDDNNNNNNNTNM